MKSKISSFILSLVVLILTGCNTDGVEYTPFKSSSNGHWGLIDAKGKIKFESEFKNDITFANHGGFFARTDKGDWLLYSTSDKTPKPVGSSYKAAGAFIEEVAPVVKPGERITLINSNGEVQVTLDKVDGKPIRGCSNFQYDGLAVILVDEKLGLINTSGEVIVKPQYSSMPTAEDGLIVWSDEEKESIILMDKTGKETAHLSSKKYEPLALGAGMLAVRETGEDGSERCGIMEKDGKWRLNPTSKIRSISAISSKSFIYEDHDGHYGVMDFAGEVKIQPRYDALFYVCGKKLYSAKYIDGEEVFIMNEKEENITDRTFKRAGNLPFFDNVIFAEVSEDDYLMYNSKGKEIKCGSRITEIGSEYVGDSVIMSDYVDTEAIAKMLDITEDGIGGLTLDMKPATAIERTMEQSTDTVMTIDPEDHRFESYVSRYITPEGYDAKYSVALQASYPSNFVDYSITQVEEKEYWYDEVYTYYRDKYNYYFKNITPDEIAATVYFHSSGVAKKFFDTLKPIISNLGSSEGKNSTELVVKGKSGYWKLELSGEDVVKLILSKNRPSISSDSGDSKFESEVVEDSVSVLVDSTAY